jgi:D-alanyl-D-alanine carboxypeptidase/D-alanyl-D-alanine-endopeptidase (penicillin-binding protein 4)
MIVMLPKTGCINPLKTLLMALIVSLYGGFVVAQPIVLQSKIEKRLKASNTPVAIWAVSVRDDDGKEIAAVNSDRLMVPASNMKLLTSAALLEELGPEFRFETHIYGNGEMVDSTWIGDLIIVGSGDPSIGVDRTNGGDGFAAFHSLYTQLELLGINQIQGRLIGNTSIFDDQSLPTDWPWYDLPFYYAPEVGALNFNLNTVFLQVNASGPVGTKPSLTWFPFNTDYVTFINNQRITSPGSSYQESYRRTQNSNVIRLGSRLPRNYKETESLTISNPTLFFLDTFKKYLSSKGIQIDVELEEDRIRRNWSDSTYTLMATHQSEPLKQLIHKLNKDSDNLYGEVFLKVLAHHYSDMQGSIKAGESAAKQIFHQMKLDTTQITIRDGSGLSATNLVSARFLTDLLHKMATLENGIWYEASLTIAGVDGTFKNRMRGTQLESNLRGKSGSISSTRSFSGYVTTKSGKNVSFSMIANNFRVSQRSIDAVHEAIATIIYETL